MQALIHKLIRKQNISLFISQVELYLVNKKVSQSPDPTLYLESAKISIICVTFRHKFF